MEDHFESKFQLVKLLRAKGKEAQADTVRNIIPKGIDGVFAVSLNN